MRKIAFLFYALFFGLFVTACGGGHPAENAAVSFFNAAYKGDTDKMLTLVSGVNMDKESEKGMAKGKLEMMAGQAKGDAEKNGGFKGVSVDPDSKSEISENSATVYLIVKFGDGSAKKERVRLVTENGAWKVKLGGGF